MSINKFKQPFSENQWGLISTINITKYLKGIYFLIIIKNNPKLLIIRHYDITFKNPSFFKNSNKKALRLKELINLPVSVPNNVQLNTSP